MREYLRVANVGDGFLKLNDVYKMNFANDEFRHYNLYPGDVLVSEGQSRDLVGQCGVFGQCMLMRRSVLFSTRVTSRV